MQKLMFIAVISLEELFTSSLCLAQGTVEVSNLGRTPTGSQPAGSDAWIGQSFLTGTNIGGYTLNSVQLQMNEALGDPGGFTVSVYDTPFNPVNSIGSLTGEDPADGGLFTYTASGITLLPSTYYTLVVTADTPVAQGSYIWSAGPGVSGNGGWSIDFLYFTSPDGVHWDYHRNYFFQMAISATPIPEPGMGWLGLAGGAIWAGMRAGRKLRTKHVAGQQNERLG